VNRIDKYFSDARERAGRGRSPWNLLLIPLNIVGLMVVWFLIYQWESYIQSSLIPKDTIFSGRINLGEIIMFIPQGLPALSLGMMLANFIVWCIPPARRVLDQEAKVVKGTSFKESMRFLFKATIVLMLIVAPLSLAGAFNCFYVKPNGITVRPLFSLNEKHYNWSDIVRIQAGCSESKDGLSVEYTVYMNDGSSINLFTNPGSKFVEAYDKIRPFIKAQPQIKFETNIDGGDDVLRRGHPKTVEKIFRIFNNED
jgi:hypothetical protein